MKLTIHETARDLPVAGAYDVVVAGGGMAGVAAAVAAARNGASVCLIEKSFGLGGLATLGNVIIWLPLCDGHGRQVSAGLAEELLLLSVRDLGAENGPAHFLDVPPCWRPGGDTSGRGKQRYRTEFNPGDYLLALEQFVLSAGVTLLYDTRLCAVVRDGARITHLIVENKSGRNALACGAAVDATGDADLCFLSGEKTESLDTNVLAGWFYTFSAGQLSLQILTHPYRPSGGREGAKGPFYRGDNAVEVTAQLLGSRELIRQRIRELRAQKPGQNIQIVTPPVMPCFRMTRRLAAGFSLELGHMHQWFPDTVGLISDWRRAGPVFALPLKSLLAESACNLLAAGRCLSADTTVWDITRAIPGCVVSGQAAGTAAAMVVLEGLPDLRALGVGKLQEKLIQQGVILDPERVKPAGSAND